MKYLLVRHRIEDFDRWLDAFNENVPPRQGVFRGGKALRNIDDANEIVVLMEVSDETAAREFMASEELRQKMGQATVSDQPDIYFLEEIPEAITIPLVSTGETRRQTK